MTRKITRISAIGTRGDVLGKVFEAKPDSSGRYVLNRKKPTGKNPATNMAASKVFAADLTEAATLLETNDYLINLVGPGGKRALRELKKVRIEAGT